MDPPVIAVYDANILYPAPLRDLFIRLADDVADAFADDAAVNNALREYLRARPTEPNQT